MAKGSSPQQTTTHDLSPQQSEILGLAMPGVRNFAATVPQRYQGTTIAPFDPLQTQGQNQVLGAAGTQGTLATSGANANDFLLGNIWDPASNPNLQGAIDAAIRPVTQRYQTVVKPGLRDEFAGAGQVFGGSRRNIAEAQGARDYLNTTSDTASKVVQGQYENNLNAYIKGLALLPQTQAAQLTPGLTTSGVGDVRQGMAQKLLGQDVANFNYDQLAPFLQSKELLALLQGIPGGSTTTTANNPGTNPVTGALGGAASGAALGSMVMPGIGTAAGAGIGALLSFLK